MESANNNSNMDLVLNEHLRHCLIYEFNMASRTQTAHKHMTKVYGKLAPTEEQCERFFATLNSIEQGEDSINSGAKSQKGDKAYLHDQLLKMKEDAMGLEEKSAAKHKASTSNMEVDAKTQQETRETVRQRAHVLALRTVWSAEKNCPGWAKTNKDLGNPRITRAHNHPQSAARVEVLQIKQSIREGALTSTSGPCAIIKQKLAGISEEAKKALPKLVNLQRTVTRKRKVDLDIYDLDTDDQSMPESPEEMTTASDGAETPTPEEFVLEDGDIGEILNPQQILDNLVTSQLLTEKHTKNASMVRKALQAKREKKLKKLERMQRTREILEQGKKRKMALKQLRAETDEQIMEKAEESTNGQNANDSGNGVKIKMEIEESDPNTQMEYAKMVIEALQFFRSSNLYELIGHVLLNPTIVDTMPKKIIIDGILNAISACVMAGQVDELTDHQYTQGHPIPRFALKDTAAIQIAQKDKNGGGPEKKQSPHQEKLPPNQLYSLRKPSADAGGNKTAADISHTANATTPSKSNTYFVVLPRRQNPLIRKNTGIISSRTWLPLIPPPSPIHQRPNGAKPPAAPAGTTTTTSSGIMLDSLYSNSNPSTAKATKRCTNVSINRERVVPNVVPRGSSKKVPTALIHNVANGNDDGGAGCSSSSTTDRLLESIQVHSASEGQNKKFKVEIRSDEADHDYAYCLKGNKP